MGITRNFIFIYQSWKFVRVSLSLHHFLFFFFFPPPLSLYMMNGTTDSNIAIDPHLSSSFFMVAFKKDGKPYKIIYIKVTP